MKYKYLDTGEFDGVYTDDFIDNNLDNEINGELVSDWLLTDVAYDESMLNPLFDGENWIESSTEEQLQDYLEKETRNAIKFAYQSEHEIEGDSTYQEFRVDLVRSLQKGDIDEAKLFEIEDLLEPVYSRVKGGNWKSANNKIEQTEVNPDATVEVWRQKAITVIQDYINNNYDS